MRFAKAWKSDSTALLKCLRSLLSLFIVGTILFMISYPTYAKCESEGVKKNFDGYLVTLSDTLPANDNLDLEEVTDGVFWVSDAVKLLDISNAAEIEYVEPNYTISLWDTCSQSVSAQTPYEIVKAEFSSRYGLTGRGVRIAVIDSGVDLDNTNLQKASFVGGYDYVHDTEVLRDEVYHGTDVIQLIVGRGANGGVHGISPEAEIVPLCCFSSNGGGTVKLLVKAIRDAVDRYDCDVINMSWGLSIQSDVLHKELQYAASHGVALIASAGNVTAKYPQGTLVYPAAFEEVIGVGAVDTRLEVLESSQQTSAVYLSAPGICGCFIDAWGEISSGTGTSFAAPCVTAAIALLYQLAPALNHADVAEILCARSEDEGQSGWDTAYGYGVLQMDLLMGEPWSAMRSGSNIGQPTVLLYGWQLHENGSVSIAAAYGDTGNIADISVSGSCSNVGSFFHELKRGELYHYKLFFLSSNYSVWRGCDVYDIYNLEE